MEAVKLDSGLVPLMDLMLRGGYSLWTPFRLLSTDTFRMSVHPKVNFPSFWAVTQQGGEELGRSIASPF